MSYEVRISSRTEKQLTRLPDRVYERVLGAILALEEEPRPRNSRKMSGRQGYRLRIGDYRAIYEVDDEERIVTVVRVGHRRDVYRSL